jgi:hypothetical protein
VAPLAIPVTRSMRTLTTGVALAASDVGRVTALTLLLAPAGVPVASAVKSRASVFDASRTAPTSALADVILVPSCERPAQRGLRRNVEDRGAEVVGAHVSSIAVPGLLAAAAAAASSAVPMSVGLPSAGTKIVFLSVDPARSANGAAVSGGLGSISESPWTCTPR